MSNNTAKKASASVLFGAAFLMATSAIGPGFLTQTSKFTAQYGAPLIMVVLCAILMDITAQMNIWSVIGVSGMRAQDVANKMLPGLGVLLAILVSIGGLAFNVGNVGGVALGFIGRTYECPSPRGRRTWSIIPSCVGAKSLPRWSNTQPSS